MPHGRASVRSSLAALAPEDGDDIEGFRSFIALAITHPNEAVRQAVARGIRDKMWEHDPAGAEACLHGALEYSRLSMFYSHRGFVLRVRQNGAADPGSESGEARQQQLAAETARLVHEISEANVRKSEGRISLTTHSAWHLIEPCLMIPMGAADPPHRNLLVGVLGLILDVESARMRHEKSEYGLDAIPQELSIGFPKLLAEHLMAASMRDRRSILEAITTRIDDALEFLPLFLACLLDRAVKASLIEDFWAMWTVIAEALVPVATKEAGKRADRLYSGDEIRPLRSLMFGDTPGQGKPEEHEDMRPGRNPILDFCRQAVFHPAVADDLARLLHHFPEVFMPDGLLLLAEHEARERDGRVLVGTNTVYYLEMVIQRLLIEQQPMNSRRLQAACLTLLDAMVETGSSTSYFMRERLVSRRVGS